MERGANALTAPTSPGKRLVVVDRTKVDPKLRKAAEGMEAMFLDYMMKIMRQTVQKSEMDLENSATQVYRSMQDSELAQKAASAGGIGLADQLIAYWETQRYNPNMGSGVGPKAGMSAYQAQSPMAVQGGTDAGKRDE